MSKIGNHPRRRTRAAHVLGLIAALIGGTVSPAKANDDGPRKALEALVPYDLAGSRTLEALNILRDRAPMEADARVKRELEFVRAVALTDLWLIAEQSENVAMLDGVSKAAGVARTDVPAWLTQELAHVEDKVVADIVQDARHALGAMGATGEGQAARLGKPVGLRSEAVFVHAVAKALVAEGDNLAALATLGSDPCIDKAPCEALYASFDAQGRKAVHTLDHALVSLAHLRASVRRDPFVEAISAQLEKDGAVLSVAGLTPHARLAAPVTRAHATQLGSMHAPDLIMLVSEGRAQLGFVPRIRVSDGKVTLYARGQPMLPEMSEIAFTGTFPAFVKTVPELVSALTPLLAQAPEATIAIAASPDAPAHVWARALLSAQSVHFPHIAMLGVDAEGVMRSLEVEIVSSLRAAEIGPRDLNVVVRLGGFTVKQAGPTVTIPRVRKEEGFAFDFDTLLQNAKPATAKSAKLTFMSDVAAETLAETAFSMAPSTSALTVVLP